MKCGLCLSVPPPYMVLSFLTLTSFMVMLVTACLARSWWWVLTVTALILLQVYILVVVRTRYNYVEGLDSLANTPTENITVLHWTRSSRRVSARKMSNTTMSTSISKSISESNFSKLTSSDTNFSQFAESSFSKLPSSIKPLTAAEKY
ncbi:unnamed protein product [Meganyctiphanes norvegica]|uniref:ATP synthase F0 subunit 8 n=1 Tax=Meganyctiphanes norvegica TaxID=48144 RepID=A0AAV2PYC6_MEGNR